MRTLRQWLRPPKALVLLLFLLTLASVSSLALFGWRFLEPERMVEAQRSQDQVEHEADRMAATVREALAKSREQLGAGLVLPGELLLTLGPTSLNAQPPGQLLYYNIMKYFSWGSNTSATGGGNLIPQKQARRSAF